VSESVYFSYILGAVLGIGAAACVLIPMGARRKKRDAVALATLGKRVHDLKTQLPGVVDYLMGVGEVPPEAWVTEAPAALVKHCGRCITGGRKACVRPVCLLRVNAQFAVEVSILLGGDKLKKSIQAHAEAASQ